MEARRRKRRCPPAPPPSPASPPPPPPRSLSPPLPRSQITAPAKSRISVQAKSRNLAPAPAQSQLPVPAPLRSQTPAMEPPQSRSPTPPNKAKQKTSRVRAYAFNSSDSDYSPNVDYDKSDSDFSTPRKRAKLFSDTDEIKILKGLLYMNKKNDKKTSVTDEVAEHINRSLRRNADFTKTQFRSKIRRIKDKYNKNRDKEGNFYKLCAKIWGDNKEEQPMNSSSPLVPRVLFENDSNVHDSCVAESNAVDFMDESNVDDLYVEDSYAEYSENNNEHHDNDNEEGNDLIARRAENKRKFKELDIMTLELSLKRLALMKETIDAVLEVIQ